MIPALFKLLSLEGFILILASLMLVCCIHDYLEIERKVDKLHIQDMELVVACYGFMAFSLGLVVLFGVGLFSRNKFRTDDLLLYIALFGMFIIVMYARITFLLLFKGRASLSAVPCTVECKTILI